MPKAKDIDQLAGVMCDTFEKIRLAEVRRNTHRFQEISESQLNDITRQVQIRVLHCIGENLWKLEPLRSEEQAPLIEKMFKTPADS